VDRPPANLVNHHRDNNRKTADGWQRFADHRARLTELALGAGGRTLAILGAGNCNDLDLERLAAAFDSIDLIDLDEEAVRNARSRLPPHVAVKVAARAPVDLSGALVQLWGWRGKTIAPADLRELPNAAVARILAAVPSGYDTVLSACMLSQIMHGCYVALGEHRQLADVGGALAVAHLYALSALARPGGQVVLITDTVSSDTYPLRELWDDQQPSALLAQLDQVGNVLSGTSVSFVRRALADPRALTSERPRPFAPWLWQMHPDVTLLVYALQWRRWPA
jgi:hypothetical protein